MTSRTQGYEDRNDYDGASICPEPAMTIELVLPDHTVTRHEAGVTGLQVAGSIGPRLAGAAVAVSVDGVLMDLEQPINTGGRFAVITPESEEGRHVLRHSAAHIMAQAVLGLFEGATLAIGPAIADGFYYDFDIGRPFTPEDLDTIEQEMERIVAADQPFVREEMSRAAGLELFRDHPYKLEIIRSVDASEVESGDLVSVYRNEGFVDLCLGPHLPST